MPVTTENDKGRTVVGYLAQPIPSSQTTRRNTPVKFEQYMVMAALSDNTAVRVDEVVYSFESAQEKVSELTANLDNVNAMNARQG